MSVGGGGGGGVVRMHKVESDDVKDLMSSHILAIFIGYPFFHPRQTLSQHRKRIKTLLRSLRWSEPRAYRVNTLPAPPLPSKRPDCKGTRFYFPMDLSPRRVYLLWRNFNRVFFFSFCHITYIQSAKLISLRKLFNVGLQIRTKSFKIHTTSAENEGEMEKCTKLPFSVLNNLKVVYIHTYIDIWM